MSDWQERLRDQITLTSPDGDVFEALWIANNRSKEKKLGIFEYPDFDGTDVQDLGIRGSRYPLTIYFEGPDCDLEGQRFYASCDQRGRWSIVHPIYGDLTLQLVSITDETDLVREGNYTRFATQWIEPTTATALLSAAEIGSSIDAQAAQANEAANLQFQQNLTQGTAGEILAAKLTAEDAVSKSDNRLRTLYENNDSLAADMAALKRGITDTLDQDILDPLVLAAQIQQLIQLPALSISSIQSRLSVYEDIVNDLSGIGADDATNEGKNQVSVIEIFMSAIAVVNAQVVASGELKTQREAVDTAVRIADTFTAITDALDASQEMFDGAEIDMQYFSQSGSYPDNWRITALGISYLLTSALDLAIEKRFTLDRPRCPIEITVSEYGDLGTGDENLDFFIETNALSGTDILLIPAGRSVVVYV